MPPATLCSSLARIYDYSDFGIVLSLFQLRAALGRSPLTLHCSFSLSNLARSSSLPLSLSLPIVARALACAACFPLHRLPLPPAAGRDRRSLQSVLSRRVCRSGIAFRLGIAAPRFVASRRAAPLGFRGTERSRKGPINRASARNEFAERKLSPAGRMNPRGDDPAARPAWSAPLSIRPDRRTSETFSDECRRAWPLLSRLHYCWIVIAPPRPAPPRPVACHSSRDTDTQDHRLSDRTVDQPSGPRDMDFVILKVSFSSLLFGSRKRPVNLTARRRAHKGTRSSYLGRFYYRDTRFFIAAQRTSELILKYRAPFCPVRGTPISPSTLIS